MRQKSGPGIKLAILYHNQEYFCLVHWELHPQTRIHNFDIKCWNLSKNITSSRNNCWNKRFQIIFSYLITKIAHIILSVHDIDTYCFYFHQRYSTLGCETIFTSLVECFRQSSKLEPILSENVSRPN